MLSEGFCSRGLAQPSSTRECLTWVPGLPMACNCEIWCRALLSAILDLKQIKTPQSNLLLNFNSHFYLRHQLPQEEYEHVCGKSVW